MTRTDIDVGGYWSVTMFCDVPTPGVNQGFTSTDMKQRRSVVVIGVADSKMQKLNTMIHEAKHLQSHICRYYGVDEDSEDAAYLIGHIAMQMHRCL